MLQMTVQNDLENFNSKYYREKMVEFDNQTTHRLLFPLKMYPTCVRSVFVKTHGYCIGKHDLGDPMGLEWAHGQLLLCPV